MITRAIKGLTEINKVRTCFLRVINGKIITLSYINKFLIGNYESRGYCKDYLLQSY